MKIKEFLLLPNKRAHCRKNLKFIASGSSRNVYELSEKYAVKFASNPAGYAQNKTEIKISKTPEAKNLVAKVVASHPRGNWIIVEKAIPIKPKLFLQHTEMDFSVFTGSVFNFYDKRKIKNNKFYKKICCLLKTADLIPGDTLKEESWGLVKRKSTELIPVLIDYGLTEEVFKKHYCR